MSQYFGMKNEKRVKDALGNSVYLLLGMGILVSFVSVLFSRNILELLNTPQEIFDDALLYTRIVCGGIISVVMYNGIAAMLQSLGDSTTSLIFLVVASVLNVIGDLLLVVVFHMGVAGVAIATIIAQLLSALGCIVYAVKKNPYFRLTKENFRPDPALMKKCLRLGIPFGAQGSLIAFSCVALQSIINRFGSDVIAAFTATSRIEQLVQQRAELVLYRAIQLLPNLSPVPSVLLERLLPVPILQLLSGGLRQRIREMLLPELSGLLAGQPRLREVFSVLLRVLGDLLTVDKLCITVVLLLLRFLQRAFHCRLLGGVGGDQLQVLPGKLVI